MSDVLMPLNLRHAQTSAHYLDASGVSKGMFGGQTIVAARGGDRLGLTLAMTKHGGKTTTGLVERAQLRSWLASLRGRQNAVFAEDTSARRRGAFPTGELLANNDFSGGTTGWTAFDATSSIAAADRILISRIVSGAGIPFITRQITGLTQYAPYVVRAHITSGRDSGTAFNAKAYLGSASGQNDYASGIVALGGAALATAVGVVPATSAYFGAGDTSVAGHIAGDFLSFRYLSMARCALVDAGPNLNVRSQTFDSITWTKNATTVTADAVAAPDGASSADQILETTANASHYVVQAVTVSSAAQDVCFSVALKAGDRTWAWLQVDNGTDIVRAFFDLGSGVVGTTSTGSNFANLRTNVNALGNSWYQCSIVVRKTSSATTINTIIGLATADNVPTYTGVATAEIYAWRATFTLSSVVGRLVQTDAAASIGTPPTGSGLYLKGLPVSTSGLLEIDDQVEVVTALGSELKILTSRLNSDAAGRGYLQFEPPLRTPPVDNAPVIVHQPFGRWLFSGDAVGWDNEPGVWSTASAEFEEA